MPTYKISLSNGSSLTLNFVSETTANTWASNVYGTGFSITEVTDPEEQIVISAESRLDADIEFGSTLIKEFLLDNRKLGAISINDSIAIKNKFKDIEDFCRYGAIQDANTLISALQTDAIFTQARKDKYLSMISDHFSRFVIL